MAGMKHQIRSNKGAFAGRRLLPLASLCMIFALGVEGSARSPEHAAAFEGDVSQREDRGSIVLVGDTQRTGFWEYFLGRQQNDAARSAVMEKIASSDPGALVLLGDLVYRSDDDGAWKWFEKFTAPVRDQHIPVYALPGNHEYFGDASVGLHNYFAHFPHLQNRLWNSFRYRSAVFILLNSNFDNMEPEEIEAQDAWYRQTLQESQADSSVDAIIVSCHHPPFTNSTVVSDDESVDKRFVPLYLATPKAVLFFSGHCHAYERFQSGGKAFVVSGGGGGPKQSLRVAAASLRHPVEYCSQERTDFHFCQVIFESGRLRVRMTKLNDDLDTWSVGDEWVVEYRKGSPGI